MKLTKTETAILIIINQLNKHNCFATDVVIHSILKDIGINNTGAEYFTGLEATVGALLRLRMRGVVYEPEIRQYGFTDKQFRLPPETKSFIVRYKVPKEVLDRTAPPEIEPLEVRKTKRWIRGAFRRSTGVIR